MLKAIEDYINANYSNVNVLASDEEILMIEFVHGVSKYRVIASPLGMFVGVENATAESQQVADSIAQAVLSNSVPPGATIH